MSFHKPDLYRWKRRDEPRVYSRSQRVATDHDIQDWIKTVEEASNRAAAETFGIPYQDGRTQGKAKARATIAHVREHDAAYAEAQDLLNQWVTEKVNLDDGMEYGDEVDGWYDKPTKAGVKRDWDNLVNLEEYDNMEPDVPRQIRHKTPSVDPYRDLQNENEDEIVSNILSNLMEKEVIHDGFRDDLGMETKPTPDPRTKMKLRHQQVKENRERREKEAANRKREQRTRKETQFQAKQIIMKEEREKAMKARKEELLLQQEVARVRKEMLDQRHLEEEKKARDRKQKEELVQKAQEELERQKWEEEQQELEQRRQSELERRRRLEVIEKFQTEIVSKNLRILQKYFSAWYSIVLKRRIEMGKARAMADWRCLLRAWNGWKTYVRGRRMEREARYHEEDMKEYHRKKQQAEDHHRLSLLRRCFMAWQIFITLKDAEEELTNEQTTTKNKMAAFLEKAATGKLWSDRQKAESVPNSGRSESTKNKVDQLFESSKMSRQRTKSGSESARSNLTSSRSETSTITHNSIHPRGLQKPRDAWQVTKRHLNLTNEQIASIGPPRSEVEGQDPARDRKLRQEMRPWEKPAPPMSSFEHRHKEQQSILKVQQKQIKEQQKLIEDLQSMQRQQLLQQQLQAQQYVSQQLNNAVSSQSLQAAQVQLQNLQNNAVGRTKDTNIANGKKQQAQNENGSLDTARTDTTAVSSATSSASKMNKRLEEFRNNMDTRAADRARIKAEREAKRKQKEEEKMAKIKAEEEERLRREEEEKKARLEARKEQKRMEKQLELEREQQAERIKHLTVMADEHYQKTLLRRRGLNPWRKLVRIAGENEERASQHYQHTIMRKCLLSWCDVVQEEVKRKEEMADMLYKFIILRRSFKNWRRHGKYFAIQEEKARRFHEKNIKWKVIQAWANYAIEAKMRTWELERLSREHNVYRMKKTYFSAWRRFPEVVRQEHERELRRAEMRKKVASILPDFSGTSRSRSSLD